MKMKFGTITLLHPRATVYLRLVKQMHSVICFFNNLMRPYYSSQLMFQGGNAKVRFQPGSGQLLAAASDKLVSIFDVETDRQIYSLQVKSTVYLFFYIII